jgi:hypothetical protein
MKLLFEVVSSLADEVRVSLAFFCLQGDVELYADFECRVNVPLGYKITHESIGRLWRLTPKQDANGLECRLKS